MARTSAKTIRALRSTRPLLASGRNRSQVREPLQPSVASARPSLAGGRSPRHRHRRHRRASSSCGRSVCSAALAVGAHPGGLGRARDAPPRSPDPVGARLALRDALTGLPNRALLDDRIEQALARSRRTEEPFALLVVDLDGFKGVNDVRGHEAGNQVLRTIARRLESVVRATDTVARVGGDEFVVRLARDRRRTRRRRRSSVGCGRRSGARTASTAGIVEIDASIGWALFPQDGLEPHRPARAGRRPDVRDEARHEPGVAQCRTGARSTGASSATSRARSSAAQVVVHYQPIVDIRLGRGPRRRGPRPARASRPARRRRRSSSRTSSRRRSFAR